MDNRDAKRKRPITCLESGATYDSAYRAAKELGFADSRNIFRSIQRDPADAEFTQAAISVSESGGMGWPCSHRATTPRTTKR